MRIRILFAGKTKDLHLRAIQQDLAARIEHFTPLSLEELPALRGVSQSRKAGLTSAEQAVLEKLRGATKILLDERGRERTSQEFAEWLGRGGSARLAGVGLLDRWAGWLLRSVSGGGWRPAGAFADDVDA